jgi:aconitase A
VLAHFGDSVTTGHPGPAGRIPVDSPAARYLTSPGAARLMINASVPAAVHDLAAGSNR